MRQADWWEVSDVMLSLNKPTVLWLIAIFCLGLFAVSSPPTQASEVILRNEYIMVTVNAREENTGRFAIKTTGGDPDRVSDDNTYLIYQREDTKATVDLFHHGTDRRCAVGLWRPYLGRRRLRRTYGIQRPATYSR